MYKCKFCGKEVGNSGCLTIHENTCKLNPNRNIDVYRDVHFTVKKNNPYKYEYKEFTLKCEKCGKEYKLMLTQKQFNEGKYKKHCSRSCANGRIHSEETKKKISEGVKTSEIFIQRNTEGKNIGYKTIDEIPKCKCMVCGNEYMPKYKFNGYVYIPRYTNKICSLECRSKYISNNNKKNHTGGFKEGSVKNYKSGWYDGIHFDSSWELAFYVYNKEHNIKIERCKEVRKYIIDNEEHEFHPDFIINNQIYEVKGIKSKNSEAKQKYNQDIKFLYRSDIKQYLDYVIDKYGKNFIDLYEKKDKVGA